MSYWQPEQNVIYHSHNLTDCLDQAWCEAVSVTSHQVPQSYCTFHHGVCITHKKKGWVLTKLVEQRTSMGRISVQGCQKLFMAWGANHAKEHSGCKRRIAGSWANHGQQGRIAGSGDESCGKGILPCSVIIIFC